MIDLKEFFVPQHCIQGENISSHLMWNPDKFNKLKIIIPEEWEFSELFNVSEENISLDKNELIIKDTELPGYFAFSLKTSRYNDPNLTKKIISVFNDDKKNQHSRKVYLFRPDIKIKMPSKKIELYISEKGNIRRHTKQIAAKSGFTRSVYPYLIKPSAITDGFNKQINPRIIQRQARHKRIETTLRYDQTTDKMVKDYFNKTQGKINNETNYQGDNIGYV